MQPMNFDETMESERAAMHGRWRSTPLCILVAFAAAGCHQSLKHSQRNDCNEIHVKAPPQKVVVDLPREEPCDSIPKAKCDEPSKPQSAPPAPSNPQAMPMSAPMAAPMAAPYAAIPSLPGGLALGLSFDWIRISIPIPRLRTVELPPEPSTAFVAMGGASVASPIVPAGYMPHQQPPCYTPEQIAEAAAVMMRRQQGAGGGASSAVEAELAKREKELEDKAKRLDDAAKKLDSLLNQAKGSASDAPGGADKSAAKDRGGWR
jgi:hypothetical protein